MIKGGRNLVILGVVSILIAMVTTGVSLAIYKYSGDIYLDRSVPGFLPDKEEIEDEPTVELDYEFEKSGTVTAEVIDEYLDKLRAEVRAIDSYDSPFGESALSDEQLGIHE
ncbi:hypothetical protein IKZ77_02085 [Candidatus Saccharibacteria bacterium]|nr:hypothetical protein [Candidatus Saccharibacteria bacterium]